MLLRISDRSIDLRIAERCQPLDPGLRVLRPRIRVTDHGTTIASHRVRDPAAVSPYGIVITPAVIVASSAVRLDRMVVQTRIFAGAVSGILRVSLSLTDLDWRIGNVVADSTVIQLHSIGLEFRDELA